MRVIIFQLLVNLLKRRNLQISLLLIFVAIGIFSSLGYQNFFYLQAQNIDQLSVFNEILKPLSGLVLISQVFIIIMTASQLVPYLFERGQQSLLLNSSLTNNKLALTHFFTAFIISLIPLCYFTLISLSYYGFSNLDVGLLLTTGFSLFMGGVLFNITIIAVSLFFRKTLTSIVFSIIVIALIFGIDEFLRTGNFSQSISIYLNFFLHFRNGLIIPSEFIRVIIWVAVFYSFLILAIQHLRLSNYRFGIILLFISISLIITNWLFQNQMFGAQLFNAWLSERGDSKKQWDISRENLNSLNNNIANKIRMVKVPIVVTAVIDNEENHDEIRQAFDIIKQYNPDSSLTFTSRQALSVNNQMSDQFVTVKVGNQQQSIRYPFDRPAKQSITQMIVQLTSRADQWITFVEGHDEASLFGKSNRDVSSFFGTLKSLGWSVASQNLSKQNMISINTKVLIIAASKKEWLPVELNAVMNYVKGGGNLLVLREQSDSFPQELQNYLAIKTKKGILIDWQGYQSGTPHPAIVIVNEFASHAVNTGINSLLAFPWSVGLNIDKEKQLGNSEYHSIIQTHQGVWNEFNSEETELSFNQEIGEQQGVFNLAYSIENEELQQRIIVVGDSSFLSDSAINNYANRQFSLNLISWLTAQSIDDLTTQYQDNFIRSTPLTHFLFKWLFSLILPVLFLAMILLLQLKKRKIVVYGGNS